jgi:CRP/FNR family cyclic AMP-dependent transcriptional regulator
VEDIERIICEHPFFAGVEPRFCSLVCGCARPISFGAGMYLFHEGEAADEFYLLREGRVALEVTGPGRGTKTFQTLGPGEIVGVSWLIPPYRWSYDARAVEPTHAIAFDARGMRQQCEEDHDVGYELMKRLVPTLIQRLQGTRLQILDVYGGQD